MNKKPPPSVVNSPNADNDISITAAKGSVILRSTILRTNQADQDAWARFLGGHWTLKAPTKPGVYPTADDTGCPATEVIAVVSTRFEFTGGGKVSVDEIWYVRGGMSAKTPGEIWLAWWWSEPRPEMPKPPPWPNHEMPSPVAEEF